MPNAYGVPSNAADMLDLARAAIRRLYLSQEFIDLFGAVLATVHLADWHFHTSPERKLDDKQRKTLRATYPEFDTLLDLANGLKHGIYVDLAKQNPARMLELKRIDAWDGDADDQPLDGWEHLGQPAYWIVKHGDRRHSVYLLCERFLDAIEGLVLSASSGTQTSETAQTDKR